MIFSLIEIREDKLKYREIKKFHGLYEFMNAQKIINFF